MFTLEHGIRSPRDGTINWVPYDIYPTVAEAKKEARKYEDMLWRIVKMKVVWNKAVGMAK